MTSAPVRDPLAGHLLAPQNAALLFMGYRPAPLPESARWTARCWSRTPSRRSRPSKPSPGTGALDMNDGCTHLAIRSYEPGEDWYWCYLDQSASGLQGAPRAPSHP